MIRFFAAALCAVGVTAPTFAQDATQTPGRDQCGPNLGASYIEVLEMLEVQADLELSPDDLANIPVLKEEVAEGDMKFGQSLQRVAPEDIPEKLNARRSEVEKQFKEVLGEKYARFRQIRLQLDGLFVAATTDKDVQDLLRVADEQLIRLGEAIGVGAARPNPNEGPPSPEKTKARMEALQKRRAEAVEKILTTEQKKQWEVLVGAKIDYKRPQSPFGQ